MLDYHPELRKTIGPRELGGWLGQLVGWAEVDSLCQNIFTAEELAANWSAWERFIQKLSRDRNINKRRAALVFLVGPVSYSKDPRFTRLAFVTMESLKNEKEILITKALSWLLRSMIALHKKEVVTYIAKNKNSLPKIALRETTRKLATGRK